jgi:dipeptidyl-peptidase 4
MRHRASGLLIVMCAAASLAGGQGMQPLTVEWIYGSEASRMTALPSFLWTGDDRLVLGTGRGSSSRLEVLDPSTGARAPLVDAERARKGLATMLGDAAPATLPFPSEIDPAGRTGLYILGGDVFLLDMSTASWTRVTSTAEKEINVHFSPDGRRVAFVRAHDLFLYDTDRKAETRLTTDGSDSLLNGTLSWVYWEEVFGRKDLAYWWSGDSRSIAFLQTDESGVSVQYYSDFKPWTPRVIRQRYPKVGETNPAVRVGVLDVESRTTTWLPLGDPRQTYVVGVNWLPGSDAVAVRSLNRLQTELTLFHADRRTGKTRPVLVEQDTTWLNLLEDYYPLKDGARFLWPSERTGYSHLYRYGRDGREINAVTNGPWSLFPAGGAAYWLRQSLVGVDEQEGWVYVTGLKDSPLERQLYRVRFDGSKFSRVSAEPGTHAVTMSASARYYVDRYSAADRLPQLRLHRSDGTTVKVLGVTNDSLVTRFGVQFPSTFSIPARDGFPLPAQLFTPAGFDSTRRYPLIVSVYGGPYAPSVSRGWQASALWDNLLAQNGFLVLKVDNRVATGISKAIAGSSFLSVMGDTELNDLVDAVRWMKSRRYVDSARVGLWGWSGGGTYTMLGMTRSAEFAAGIAVAGVTDFRFYDTKWAEEMMKTEKENAAGLAGVSLLPHAKALHGRLLIVHGTYDDNVHIQNAWAFADELIRANKRFDMMIYPMRMHGISDTPARVHLYSTMLDFWKTHLASR